MRATSAVRKSPFTRRATSIELLYLPAYSPDLNLIERLWKLTKKKCLTNRHYPNFRAPLDRGVRFCKRLR